MRHWTRHKRSMFKHKDTREGMPTRFHHRDPNSSWVTELPSSAAPRMHERA